MTKRIAILATFLSLLSSAPALAQTANVNLAWDPSPSTDVARYRIYAGTAPSGEDAGVFTVDGSQTTYTFAATPGVLYYFAVSAVSSEGVEGPRSESISGSIPLLAPVVNRASTVDVPIVAVHLSADDPDGGVVRFTHTGLPPGLVLDWSAGIITGIPISTGTFTVTVFASDGVLTSSRSFDWTVQTPGSGDTMAPSVLITSHSPGQSVISPTVTISGTATDGGLGDTGIVRVTVNGQLAAGGVASGNGVANWSRTLTLAGASDTIVVEALDGTGNYAAELITLTRDVLAPALSITSHTSGQTVTTSTITLSGTATDSGRGGNGITSVTVGGVTASGGVATGSDSATWSRVLTLSSGQNTVAVVARDAGGNARTESITIRYTPPALAVTSLTSNLASPQALGTSIRFTTTASGGTAPYQFKWWVQSGGVWYIGQNWSSISTFNWQPTTGGTYVVAVWARNAGVTTDASQALGQVSYVISSSGNSAPLSIASLTSDQSSPSAVGTTINFTAAAAGGSAPYQFKWWVQSGGVWYVAREWSNSPTLAWQATTAGSYVVAVWARNAGVTADTGEALGQVPYVISTSGSGTSLSIASLTSDQSSPGAVGTMINFTAAATGGSAPYQFKWWVLSGGVWYVAREWSSSPTLAWRPTTAGSYVVAVWARNAGVTADAGQALAQTPYVATASTGGGGGTALSLTGLWSNIASPQLPGGVITFTTAASGGSAPHQFKWWVLSGGVWSVAQNWSTSTSFAWRPTSAGTYVIAVWARNAGVSADASQALAQTTYVIAPDGTGSPTLSGIVVGDAGPQSVGSWIRFTTSASGGRAPYQFKWWVYDGNTWSVAQDWSSNSGLWWRPTRSGNYIVAAWVRNAGVTVDASESLAQVPYLITP